MDINSRMYHLLEWPDQPAKKKEPSRDEQEAEDQLPKEKNEPR